MIKKEEANRNMMTTNQNKKSRIATRKAKEEVEEIRQPSIPKPRPQLLPTCPAPTQPLTRPLP